MCSWKAERLEESESGPRAGAAGKSLKKFEELLRDHNDLCAKIAEAAEEVRGHLGAAVSSTAASARR